jgi:serine protease
LRFLEDDAPHPVLIGYKKRQQQQQGSGGGTVGALSTASASEGGTEEEEAAAPQSWNDPRLSGNKALDRVSAKKGTLTRSEIQALLDSDPDILYVEEDRIVYALVEVSPYGVSTIRADNTQYPPPVASTGSGAPCSDPNSFKIGIVDSGLDVNHPDLPCFNVDDSSSTNCVGQTFGVSLDGEWFQPTDIHGTAVAGIIGAVRGNGIGVTGVLNNDNVCLVVARVFASDGQAMLSDVLEAVRWVADQGASVLNLSLGGPSSSQAEEETYQDIRNEGKLVVCASGNDGTTDLFYPASFASTVSVGAVDASLNRATFSQFNSEVDLVAPGVSILSTAPLGAGKSLSLGEYDAVGVFSLVPVAGSPSPPTEFSGTLVECTNLGQDTCPGSGSHVCIIERYVFHGPVTGMIR